MRIFLAFLMVYVTTLPASELVSLAASNTTPTVGASFTVTVNISDATAFTTCDQALRFNPANLELTGMAAGNLGTFVEDSRGLSAINASGEVGTNCFKIGNPPMSGNGSLAIYTFRVRISGNSQISLFGYNPANPRAGGTNLIDPAHVVRVPALGPALSIVVGGSTITRQISLQVRSGASPISNLLSSISPAAGGRADTADTFVFTGLNPQTQYQFALQLPPQVNQ